MSLNDPVVTVYDPTRQQWYLKRGRETFYDDDRKMILFDSQIAAFEWCVENLGVDPRDNGLQPDPPPGQMGLGL